MFDGIKQEIKRPATLVAVLLAVAGIIFGLFISLYFYYKSIRQGTMYYQIEQLLAFDQTTITGNTPLAANPVYVVDQTGNKLEGNIYVAKIRVWNGGNDEIKDSDVREPFRISLENEGKLVNIIISETTHQNVDQFKLEGNNIKWTSFDPGDGFSVRLIYTSDKQKDLSVTGRAINTGGPSNIGDLNNFYANRLPKYMAMGIFGLLLAGLLVAYFAGIGFGWVNLAVVVISLVISVTSLFSTFAPHILEWLGFIPTAPTL